MSPEQQRLRKIEDLRMQITAMVPGIRIDSLEAAATDIERHCARLKHLYAEWRASERRGGAT